MSSGFADTIQGLQLLGLLDSNPHTALHPKGPDITWVSSAVNVQFHRNDMMGRKQNWLMSISWWLLLAFRSNDGLFPVLCSGYHIQPCTDRNMLWGNKNFLSECTEHIVLSSVNRWCMQLPVMIPWVTAQSIYCHSFLYSVILQTISKLLRCLGCKVSQQQCIWREHVKINQNEWLTEIMENVYTELYSNNVNIDQTCPPKIK